MKNILVPIGTSPDSPMNLANYAVEFAIPIFQQHFM